MHSEVDAPPSLLGRENSFNSPGEVTSSGSFRAVSVAGGTFLTSVNGIEGSPHGDVSDVDVSVCVAP